MQPSNMGANTASPTTETTDVLTKPRQRRRDGYFWQLLILRIPVAFFAIAIIAHLVHYVRKWQGAISRPEEADLIPTRKDALGQSGLPLSMASVSLAVAVWETLACFAPRHRHGPRSMDFALIFFDLLVIGLGIPGWFNLAMAEYYTDPGYPTPWREDQSRAATMVIVFWILHCVMAMVGCSACCGCCGCGSASTKPKKAEMTTNAPVKPAKGPDLEQAVASEPLSNCKQSTGLEEIEPAIMNQGEPPSYLGNQKLSA